MNIPSCSYRSDSLPENCTGDYRFGFNGMESEGTVYGEGNSYTTEFRQYDTRIGKWLSLDPIIFPFQSPYCAFDNNPLIYSDVKGDSTLYVFEGEAIHVSHDNLENAIVDVWDIDSFNELFNCSNGDYELSSNDLNFELRKTGITYLLQGYDQLWNDTEEGGQKTEYGKNLYFNNGIVTPGVLSGSGSFDMMMPSDYPSGDNDNPEDCLGYKVGQTHSHNNIVPYGASLVYNFSTDDILTKYTESPNAIYGSAVDERYIHFYGSMYDSKKFRPVFSVPRDYMFDANIIGKLQALRTKLEQQEESGIPKTVQENLSR
jgi:RHS repeat-associated protein